MSGEATRGAHLRPRLAADLIAQRGFMVVRRGYDQDEVRAFLGQVAAEVRSLNTELEDLAAAPRAAQPAPAAAPAPAPVERLPLDEESLVALVGEETATVLRAARTAAADLRRRAETEAERIVGEARQAAGDIRQDAEQARSDAQRDAEAAAEEVLRAARTEADQLVAKARSDADGLREQAEHERRLTVDGAQAVREKILGDLSRRRRVATVQIEQLRAGRERLLESYAVVRRTLEEVHDELQKADSEARSAADEAGRRAEAAPDPGLVAPVSDAAVDPSEAADAAVAADQPSLDPGVAGDPGDPGAAGRPPGGVPPRETGGGIPPSAGQPPRPGGRRGRPAPRGADRPDVTDSPDAGDRTHAIDAAAHPAGGVTAGGDPPAPPAPRSDAGVLIGDDGGIERVRVLRPERSERRPGSPVLRPLPGGRMTAGGDRPVGMAAPAAARRADDADTGASDHTAGAAPDTDTDTDTTAEAAADTAETATGESAGHAGAVPERAESGTVTATAGKAPRRSKKVEGMFDRIRAERAASVADAKDVLEQPAPEHPAPEQLPDAQDATGAEEATDAQDAPDERGAQAGEEDDEPARSDEDEALLQRRDHLVGDIEAALTKRLKRVLQDEQNELLDRLRSVRGTPKAATLLPDEPDHVARVAGASRPLLDRAARAGATFVGVEGGDEAAAVAADAAEEVAAALIAPLRRRLSEAIRDNAGDEQAVLVEAIGGVYRECKTQRVEPAVIDGISAAFSAGAYAATPAASPLRWVVEDTDGPCPDCDDNALAGLQPKGEAFPTGQLHPPAHAGCRCLLTSESTT